MTDDATLSDFGSSSGDNGDTDGQQPPDETDAGTDHPTENVSSPADRSTYAYGEYTCTRCEASTDRVWRDEGVFVCPDCKVW